MRNYLRSGSALTGRSEQVVDLAAGVTETIRLGWRCRYRNEQTVNCGAYAAPHNGIVPGIAQQAWSCKISFGQSLAYTRACCLRACPGPGRNVNPSL
ncbi:MAG: hypothetical protein KTR19_07700 [Hyphomicrobiales bacterium]|nr:hypothetical protein [Hyphomicrobiales bacterium]